MNLALFIAKRYIVSKKSNNAINIISWISVGAIAVGTGALLIILSGMNGLTNLVQGLYNSFDADIEITAAKGKVFVPDKTRLAKLSALKGIKEVCLVLEDNALLKFDDKQAVATVKGVSENYVNMSRFDTLIYEGSFFTRENNKVHAVFGKGLAFRLGTGVKDVFNPVSVYAPIRGAVNSLNPEDAFEELKVYPSGVYTINDDFDFKYMLTSISAARRLFGYTEEVSSLELGCETGADLEQVQHDLEDIMAMLLL